MATDQENERVERRTGPADRRDASSDRRGNERVVEESTPRRQNPDRRQGES